jgi:hypothetical protein
LSHLDFTIEGCGYSGDTRISHSASGVEVM